jgi:hypothetical protein
MDELTVKQEPAILLAEDATSELAEAARIAELHRELRLATLRLTKPEDWVDYDGQPYLSASGADKLKALYRIRTRNVRWERVEEPGRYLVVVTGEAASELLDPNGWWEVVGACASDDRFLTRGGRIRPTFGDVLKKAQTNWRARAVKQLAGLAGVTWEELERHGIRRDRVKRVELSKADDAAVEWVAVKLREYRHKDEFKAAVRKATGINPRWDGVRSVWMVPAPALAAEDVVQYVTPVENGEQHQTEKGGSHDS